MIAHPQKTAKIVYVFGNASYWGRSPSGSGLEVAIFFTPCYNKRMSIPRDFKRYWSCKPRMSMTLEECWTKWKPYWHLRQNGPNNLPYGDTRVLARYGDKGDYTVDNCRVITHRENTLERDHGKCSDKLKGKVHNPEGGRRCVHRGQRVRTPRGEFDSCASAARKYGMHPSSMWHRLQSERYPDYEWL